MKILLIQPPNKFLEQSYGIKKKVKFGHLPPLGIGILASYLEMDNHEVHLLDASALQLSMDETLERIHCLQPNVIGHSTLTNYADSVKILSNRIKAEMPSVVNVLGGPHATYFYDQILDEMPGIDHIIYGEADLVIRDYARYLYEPDKLFQIPGLVYRREGKVIVNPPAPMIETLDEVPMPAFHLYEMSLYRPLPFQYQRLPVFSMITSRGCWWRKCKFCFQAGRKAVHFRRQSPKRVVEEISILYHQYGIREISFWDDTFIQQTTWLTQFNALLKEKKIDITFSASGRVNAMTEEVLQTIQQAGCWSMFLGIESGNQDLLDMIDKGITLEQARNVVKIANRLGIETRAAFMLGLPGEDPEKAGQTIAFAIELDPTYAIFYATHPRVGTQLYDIAINAGTFLDKNFHGMSKVTYVPEGYKDAMQLEQTIQSAYRKFYLRPHMMLKYLRKVRSLESLKEAINGFFLYLGLSRNTRKY
ncbi:MAG: B12-binding domain-containing radical SAM protein [Desulfobacula sp.]|nr:B12-binding domain-containing radical SAM protein [Desulfobacula sp.]